MTVTDLIKKLQQYQQFGQIAAVRIEFGDGSIYNDPPLERRVMQTAIACNLNTISQENLHRYKELFRRVQAAITDRRELEDGYVFRLNGESLSLPDLAEWISLAREISAVRVCTGLPCQVVSSISNCDFLPMLRFSPYRKSDL
jgi:hypothetical protein